MTNKALQKIIKEEIQIILEQKPGLLKRFLSRISGKKPGEPAETEPAEEPAEDPAEEPSGVFSTAAKTARAERASNIKGLLQKQQQTLAKSRTEDPEEKSKVNVALAGFVKKDLLPKIEDAVTKEFEDFVRKSGARGQTAADLKKDLDLVKKEFADSIRGFFSKQLTEATKKTRGYKLLKAILFEIKRLKNEDINKK